MLPKSEVIFHSENPELQKLWDLVQQKCRENLKNFGPDRVLIEGGGYEKIWLETQPMGGEMYALHDLEAGMNNTLLFIRHQRADGRLPGSIQYVDGRQEAQFNKFQGFCFPWHALNLYYLSGKDEAYLDHLEECLKRFDAYLWARRDSNGDGLLEAFCVYDTGEDNAVRYGDAPCWWSEEEPPEGYQIVPMASMDFMSFSYASRATLAEICRIRGDEKAAEWERKAKDVADTIHSRLWDEDRGACFDLDKNGNRVDVLCHNTLRCMYWGSLRREDADRFVKEHLLNPQEFWTNMPLPSVAVNDPAFRNAPENNWSGQSEGLTWQRAIRALENYGYEKIVTALGRRFLRALIDGGYLFTQQFDPFTGEPSRVGLVSHQVLGKDDPEPFQDAYGPTMLAAMEYIAHLWGIDLEEDRVLFSMARARMPYEYSVRWNGHSYTVRWDGKTASALADGREIYSGVSGLRIITDLQGSVLRQVALENAPVTT